MSTTGMHPLVNEIGVAISGPFAGTASICIGGGAAEDSGQKREGNRRRKPSLVNLMKVESTAQSKVGSSQASGSVGTAVDNWESGYICGGSRGLVYSSNSPRVIVWSTAERFIYSAVGSRARG